MAFVQEGGLLVTGPKWPADGKPAPPDFNTQFDLRAVGKGRLAIAKSELADAYTAVVDIQFLDGVAVLVSARAFESFAADAGGG